MKHDPVVLAKRAALAATVLFIHTALIAAAIATVYGTEKWIHFLWSDTDPLLFDRVPYRFLFQAIDCVFIGLLAVWASETLSISSKVRNDSCNSSVAVY